MKIEKTKNFLSKEFFISKVTRSAILALSIFFIPKLTKAEDIKDNIKIIAKMELDKKEYSKFSKEEKEFISNKIVNEYLLITKNKIRNYSNLELMFCSDLNNMTDKESLLFTQEKILLIVKDFINKLKGKINPSKLKDTTQKKEIKVYVVNSKGKTCAKTENLSDFIFYLIN